MMPGLVCTKCGKLFPVNGFPTLCLSCGGMFDFNGPFEFHERDVNRAGLWQWGNALALPDNSPVVSLGEGDTPLVDVKWNDRKVFAKIEAANPTGSYKDRGSATTVSWLAARKVTRAVEDSSGNAGASFAAYAARAGIHASVYVPENASGPKREQIATYGAEVIAVPGQRSEAAQAVLTEAAKGFPYASHAYLPFGLPGIATMAYEIVEQLGTIPGTIVAPLGHGGLMLGLVRGFEALMAAGKMACLPYWVGVQAAEYAPFAILTGTTTSMPVSVSGNTIAEGVRVQQPSRLTALNPFLTNPSGEVIAIPESEILPARDGLANEGIFVEPTSALCWAALKYMSRWIEPVVMILTGSGYKTR